MRKIDSVLLNNLFTEGRKKDRKRTNYNFHREMADPLQRLINSMQIQSYVWPHKHENPDKREAFILLSGKVAVIEYDEKGKIIDHIILSKSSGNLGVDFDARSWHSIIVLEPNSTIYETKDGPYEQMSDKNFAEWAPAEGSENTILFEKKILHKIGIKYPFEGDFFELFIVADNDLQQARIQDNKFQKTVLLRKILAAANAAFEAQFYEYALALSSEGLALAKSIGKNAYESIFLENILLIYDVLY